MLLLPKTGGVIPTPLVIGMYAPAVACCFVPLVIPVGCVRIQS